MTRVVGGREGRNACVTKICLAKLRMDRILLLEGLVLGLTWGAQYEQLMRLACLTASLGARPNYIPGSTSHLSLPALTAATAAESTHLHVRRTAQTPQPELVCTLHHLLLLLKELLQ